MGYSWFRLIKQDQERMLQAVYLVLLFCQRSICPDYSTYDVQFEQKDDQTTFSLKIPSDLTNYYLPSKQAENFHPIHYANYVLRHVLSGTLTHKTGPSHFQLTLTFPCFAPSLLSLDNSPSQIRLEVNEDDCAVSQHSSSISPGIQSIPKLPMIQD